MLIPYGGTAKAPIRPTSFCNIGSHFVAPKSGARRAFRSQMENGGLDSDGRTFRNAEEMWTEELGHADPHKKSLWYNKGINYWQGVEATVDGVLGGYGHVNAPDIKASEDFLNTILAERFLDARHLVALDCGSGIGRVTKNLLIRYFNEVDLLEPVSHFLESARVNLAPENLMVSELHKAANFYCVPLQEFTPDAERYDIIWVQWCIGHLADDDFIAFFKRAKLGLKPGGLFVLKENIARTGFVLDKEDKSITRSDSYFKELFNQCGLYIYKMKDQKEFPDELFAVKMYALTTEMPRQESPASQSLRRGPGRPPKQISDVTEAPAVSPPPASPLGSTGDSPLASLTTNTPEPVASTPLGLTRDSSLVSATANNLEAAASTPLGSIGDTPLISATGNTPEAIAPTSLGSTSDRPLEIPSDEEETKLNVKSSRVLMHPPNANYRPQIPDEESKKVILGVGSLLVKKLLTSENDVGYMVHQANATFICLKALDVDYASFYREVTEYISHRCNLLDAQREETMLSLPVLQENYENAKSTAIDVEEDFGRTQGEWEKAKEKEETLKRQIEDLKQELAQIEHKKECLKEAHEVAKAKEQEIGTQLEAAQATQTEIQQRKDVAHVGIESTTQRLKSTYHV